MPKRSPLEDRLWAKIDKDGPVPEHRPDLGHCWLWTGADNGQGYGTIGTGVDNRVVGTHRAAYEMLVGPIPDGLQLDHLCRVRRCCNPAHLEPVTHVENMRRGNGWSGRHFRQTHCKRGHEFTEANTILVARGRDCAICRIERRRARTERDRLRRVAARDARRDARPGSAGG